MTVLLRRTIRGHLRRAQPEKILDVLQRIHLRFFQACGLASDRNLLRLVTKTMSDVLLAPCDTIGERARLVYLTAASMRAKNGLTRFETPW